MRSSFLILGLLLSANSFAAEAPESFLLRRVQCGGDLKGSPQSAVVYIEELSDGTSIMVRGKEVAAGDFGLANRGHTTFLTVHYEGALSHRFAIDEKRLQAQESTFPGQGDLTPVGKPLSCKIEEGDL